MPYSFPKNIPKVAKNWTPEQQKACVRAANAVLAEDGSEQDAIFACIHAAGKTKNPGGKDNKSGQEMIWVDLFDAGKVLAGQEVLLVPLMPDGYVRGGMRRPPITAQDLQIMATNFQKRASSGYYQTNLPLNIEHEPTEGKIGTIKAFRVGDDGGYAIFELTTEGSALLEGGKFDYLSPEIRWDTQDVITGEVLGPSLVGAAVTNYPFFGDRTAMYSARAQEKMAEEMPLEARQGLVLDLVSGITGIIQSIGWRVSDLRWIEERGDSDLPLGQIVPELQEARKSLMLVLAQAAAVLPDMASHRALLELYAVTKLEDGVRYPRSAYAVVLEMANPTTWHGRYKGYVGDELTTQPNMLGVSRLATELQGLSDDDTDRAWSQVYRVCDELGIKPRKTGGGSTMGNNDQGQGESERAGAAQPQDRGEEYATRLTGLEAEIATYRAAIAERDQVIAQQGQQLSTLTEERLAERFAREASGYNALGADREELASHLMWLFRADTGEGQPHYAWFRALLETVNGALSQAASFSEIGHSREVTGGSDPWRRIEAAVQARAKAKGIGARPGSPAYSELLGEVLQDEPALFNAYRESLISD